MADAAAERGGRDGKPPIQRDGRYDILFQSVRIGPVTARNRFYQVSHCNGMGHRDPTALAVMRGVKAEGGWAVVCTEQVDIHHSSDVSPYVELRLWDDRDIPALQRMAKQIHEHGSLAGIELVHNGMSTPNHYTRTVPMGPGHLPVASYTYDPVQARRMDATDIKNMRRWHVQAVRRAKRAGFDLIYVYAAHSLGFLHHFLSRRFNMRTDEYGGTLENRTRLLREIVEEAKAAVGDTCAVPVRISMDELVGEVGLYREEVEDMIGLMAELPDLWDVTVAGWENDSRTSRFSEEGAQEPFISGVKRLTTKPVVGVGRYTSPDRMAALVRNRIVDLIGAARPSIADPFLPRKIEQGRFDDIRECIGCNICVAGDFTQTPLRCTQNPTMGEEWRRGWHPERVKPSRNEKEVLIVGGGPAGLEAAQVLGKRGYPVTLAEAGAELGGRAVEEARLPGLSAWRRVADYRKMQIDQLANVSVFLESRLTTDDVLEFGFPRVLVATGATWRSDGVGRHHTRPIPISEKASVLSPSDIMAGRRPAGRRVVIWDDDHYYMAGVLAELMADSGFETLYLTPASEASTWTRNTMEQHFIQTRLLEKGVTIKAFCSLEAIDTETVTTSCIFTGRTETIAAESVILVTARLPNEGLSLGLAARRADWADAGIEAVTTIGDALAPATIAHATYSGRRYAEELDDQTAPEDELPFRREMVQLLPLE